VSKDTAPTTIESLVTFRPNNEHEKTIPIDTVTSIRRIGVYIRI